jgi:uncharacterized protein YprB with RNaseH-like and TPR domain
MRLQDLAQYGVATPTRPSRPRSRRTVEEYLSGRIVGLGGSQSFYREERFGPEHRQGRYRAADVTRVPGRRLSMLTGDAELAYGDMTSAVFLDTETTGLGMGTGTYVFLVGLGYVKGDCFHVRQFFLAGPGDEVSFLSALGDFLSGFSMLVTFNGKAFDWPLMEGRFARFRRPPPLADPLHVDLLHPARGLWKRRLESCALASLERDILGLRRTQEDVPGYEIPGRYFAYLRGADGDSLAGVFYHNMQDILSLAALAVHVDSVLADPYGGLVEDASDFISLGRIYERAGEPGSAAGAYAEALARGLESAERAECLTRLAALQKRERLWEAALATWERLLEEGGIHALLAFVEMAKYYEHVEADYAQALDAVRGALTLAELRPSLQADIGALEHRLSRLLNRVATRGRRRART